PCSAGSAPRGGDLGGLRRCGLARGRALLRRSQVEATSGSDGAGMARSEYSAGGLAGAGACVPEQEPATRPGAERNGRFPPARACHIGRKGSQYAGRHSAGTHRPGSTREAAMKITLMLLALLALLAAAAPPATAQPVFEEATPTDNPWFVTPDTDDFWINAIAPADVDGDGDIDLAVMGFYVVYNESAEDKLLLFLNDGEGEAGCWAFTPVEVPLGGLFAGATDLSWA